MDTSTSIFNMDQKFDLAALLKSAASNMVAASNGSTPTHNNNTIPSSPGPDSASPTLSGSSPTNAQQAQQLLNTNLINPITQITLNNHSPFVPIRPVYAPSGYGRQILIYDSRSYPGCRREFAYKTRFTNQSGLTTVYYRCMACRALRHRLQRIMPKDKLPAVPCIAVKNEMLINDPDFPEASDHFCTPLTIEESNNRLKITFERGFKRARMKLAAEDSLKKTASATCEIDESTTNPINIDQYLWTKTSESASCLLIHSDETAQSSSSEASKDCNEHHSNTTDPNTDEPLPKRCQSDATNSHEDEDAAESDTEMVVDLDSLSPRKRLDQLLRLQEQRQEERRIKEDSERDRDKSTSPDENLNVTSFAQKLMDNSSPPTPSFLNQLGSGVNGAPNGAAANGFNIASLNSFFNQTGGNAGEISTASFLNFQALAAKLRGSELLKALNKPSKAGSNNSSVCASPALYNGNGGYAGLMNNGVCNANTSTPHMSEILNKYIKNNWDLPENSGNSRSAAELTCTLILAMARHVPQAAASMKQGKWARKDFMGEEVYGKTLAIIGLGRIGQEVASRMQAFGMKTVGYDPLVSNEDAAKRQIKWLSLEDIWPIADYITVHVPLIPQTKDLLNRKTLAQCKEGARIINVARGGIINEKDLVDSLNANHIGGAAIDVFVEEPPTYGALVEHPKVVCTPHLGASTLEAQQRVAIEIAENIISLNNGTGIFGALNASALAAVLDETKSQYVTAASNLAQVLASLAPNTKNVVVKHPAGANGLQKALIAGTVVGLLQANGCAGLNLVNAEVNAIKEGIVVKTEQTSGNELTLSTNGNNSPVSVTGYASPAGTVISAINGAKVPVPVLAVGNLAISKQSGALDHKFGSKASVEYGLLGGGHLALFGELDNEEIDELSKAYSIVQFGQ